MLEETIKNNLLYHYLLGTLSDPQQEQLENDYFSQPERRQELWAVFDEMAERFFQGALEPHDAQKFAVQLQTKPFLRARAESLYALYHSLSATVPTNNLVARQSPEWPIPSFRKWFAIPALSWGLLAACVLFFGVGALLLSRQTTEQERQIAQAQPTVASGDLPPLPPVIATPTAEPSATLRIKPKLNNAPAVGRRANLVAFYILQEDARAQGEAIKLSISEQTQTVELHFEVQPPFLPNYQGVAKTSNGRTFKSFTNLKVQHQKNIALVTLPLVVAEIRSPHFTVQIKTASAGKDAPPLVSQVFRLEKE